MNTFLIENQKSQCCGCSMCAFVCPTNAIKMDFDSEGFSFPVVNSERCINCNKCGSVCPMDVAKKSTQEPKVYAAHSKNHHTVKVSSSGGVVTELANRVIADGGYVCGCTMDSKHQVKHVVIDRVEDLPLLQGSKYVQSDLSNCFDQLSLLLKQGKNVLFVGTPCQTSAVKNQFPCDNLMTVDLLCHGVPSQKLFDFYVEYLEHKHRGELTEFAFRDKEKFGWSITQRYKIKKKNRVKTYYLERHTSEYFTGFLRNMTQRESCFGCPYTSLERVGDITLADFWGIEKIHPDLLNLEGTSLVLVNSAKGMFLLNEIQDSVSVSEVNTADATYQQAHLVSPPERSKLRDTIYGLIFSHGFKKAGKKYLLPKNSYKYKIAQFLNINVTKKSLTRSK